MAKADWSYQVPPAGASSSGLEEYVVEAASGARVGKVMTLVRRDGEVYVVVERGSPPLSHDLRAFPWGDVDRVDHSALTVRLKLAEDAVDGGLKLDPDKGVETGEADAVRVTQLPAELAPSSAPGDTTGPVDRPGYLGAMALGLIGVFSLLVLALLATRVDFTWHFALFAIPLALLALALLSGYRTLRSPYERR